MAEPVTAERLEQPQSALGSVVEADGFRVESMSLGNSDEGLKATLQEFLDGEKAAAPATAKPAAEPAVAAPAAEPAAGEPKPKGERRLDAIQQRIAEATRRKHEADAAVADAERRLRELEARLAPADPAAAAPATPATPAPAAADPKPRWTGDKGYEAQGKTYADFEDDLEAWEGRAEQRRTGALTESLTETQKAEREKAEQADRDRYFDQRHAQRLEKLRTDPEVAAALTSKEFEDMPATPFMTTLVKLHDKGAEVMRHFALNPAEGYEFSNLTLSREIKEAFRDSENPVGLISALVNDPEEAARIATLSGNRAHKALWALEQPTADAKAAPLPTAPRQLATPLPGKVQASRSVATKRPLTELSTDDFDEFLAREMAGETP